MDRLLVMLKAVLAIDIAMLVLACFSCSWAVHPNANSGMLRPEMEVVENIEITHEVNVAQQHAPHEIEKVEAGKLDDDGQLIDEPEYIEEVVDSYGQVRQYYDRGTGFAAAGIVSNGNGEFTWYSQKDMPGGGLEELNANGRHVDDRGFVVDGDGYIAVALPDQEVGNYEKGDVIDTPYGPGKVYDRNEGGTSWDIYTDY